MESILRDLKTSQQHRPSASSQNDFVIRENRQDAKITTPSVGPKAEEPPSHISQRQVVEHDSLLTFLRASPGIEALSAVLQKISSAKSAGTLSLAIPGPRVAQITRQLVEKIVPEYYHALTLQDQMLVASALRTLSGINAVLIAIRALLKQNETDKQTDQNHQNLLDLISVTSKILSHTHSDVLLQLWTGLESLVDQKSKHLAIWKEIANLFGSGKIMSTIAEAQDAVSRTKHNAEFSLAAGPRYARWLGDQIIGLALAADEQDLSAYQLAATQVLDKSMSLGYPNDLMRAMIPKLSSNDVGLSTLSTMLAHLSQPTRQRFLTSLVTWLSTTFAKPEAPVNMQDHAATADMSDLAGLLAIVFRSNDFVRQEVTALLMDATTSTLFSFGLRLATFAAVAQIVPKELVAILRRCIVVFGDQLFITHASLQQQDALAQNILICAGYLHSDQPQAVLQAARSSGHMQGVSNRLACNGERARWLGMIVGTGMSRLVDEGVTKMDFGTADMQTAEATAYLGLINVVIPVGNPHELFTRVEEVAQDRSTVGQTHRQTSKTLPIINGKQAFGPEPPLTLLQKSTGPQVVELDDEELDADSDLKPYAKPDSDPEDSEEDATLVNRKKVRPPVYIRSLMAMLRSSEDAERFQLGIRHAAGLIRRKTGRGREVSDHAEELARILANLQDPFETDDFDLARLQALVALVVSDVTSVAPWLSRQAFASDYSLAQRMMLLSALGFSGRELAGLQTQDQLNPPIKGTDFPSKRLPPRLAAIYDQNNEARALLKATSDELERSLVQPLALKAADQTTSQLDAVKVRTFSSRMDVERTRRRPKANALAKVFKQSYFDLLISSFQANIAAYQDSSVYASSPALLAIFIKTIAILLNAAGPATLEISQITSDTWTLLLFLRVKAIEASDVTESILLCLLTIFDLYADNQKVLATEHSQQLLETKDWVELVFDRTGAGVVAHDGFDEESRIQSLCAAILTRVNETIETYQKTLMGRWTDI